MSGYGQRLLEILGYAGTRRVTDRKKFIKGLEEIYENQEAVQEIHSNSKSNSVGRIDWHTILDKIHMLCLQEADKKHSLDRIALCTLMLTTVSKANGKAGILLTCSDLLSLVLQIFNNQRYVDYHETYMTILVDHVLPVRQYRAAISSDNWKALLSHCIKLYDIPSHNMQQSFILDGLCKVVQYGCSQSHLVLEVKKILPFLERILQNAKLNNIDADVNLAFKVANTICQQISAESRVALCEFGESILQDVIPLNGSDEKYDWLLLMVRVHHPGGVTMNHNAAHVSKPETWNKTLQKIYSMVMRDSNNDELSEHFVTLVCEVCRQLMEDPHSVVEVMCDNSLYSQPNKRRRVTIGFQGAFDMLNCTVLNDTWPVIQISALIKKYPECMKANDFVSLLKILTGHLGTCKNIEVLDCLYGLGKVLVELKDSLADSYGPAENPELLWTNIWDMTLRSVSMNQVGESGHHLLQSLIQQKKMNCPNAFLRLYLTDTIKWSPSSVRTLLIFCEHNIVPDCTARLDSDTGFEPNDVEPTKIRLLKWVLSIPPDKLTADFPIEDVSELLVGLTMKLWHKKDMGDPSNGNNSASRAGPGTESQFESIVLNNDEPEMSKNIEMSYLVTMFELNLHNEVDVKTIQTHKRRKVNVLYQKDAVNVLIANLSENIIQINGMANVDLLTIWTALVAKVITNLRLFDMIECDIEDFCLTASIKQSLKTISRWSVNISDLRKTAKRRGITRIIQALNLLYKTSYDHEVVNVILSSSTQDLLQNLFILVEAKNDKRCVDDDNCDGDDDYFITDFNELADKRKLLERRMKARKDEGLSNIDRIRLEAIKALTSFSCRSDSDVISSTQRNVLKSLLNHEKYKISQLSDFKMTVTILESMVKCKPEYLDEKTIERSIKLVLQLCREWYTDHEAARIIICILRDFFELLSYVGNSKHRGNLLRTLGAFRKLLQESKYGPLVYIEFIQCLCHVARIDPSFTWTKWDEQTPVVEEVLMYINSPFHIVRLEAIKCVHLLFSLEGIAFQWQRNFFGKLREAVMKSVVVKRELNQTEDLDENLTRTASALHTYAAVITSSAVFRNQALLWMLQLATDKEMKTTVVRKALQVTAKQLNIDDRSSIIEDHLEYLLTYWLSEQYSIERFPWAVTGCSSEEQFWRTHINILVPIKIQNGELTDVPTLCEKLGLSFVETVENSFPRIISWLLPHLSADPANPPPGIKKADLGRASKVFKLMDMNLNEFQSVQRVSDLLDKNLERVIVTLLKRLHDEDNFTDMLNVNRKVHFPVPDPPHFGAEVITRSFEYLEGHLLTGGQSLVYRLATERKSVLQKVLMDLTCSVHGMKFAEYKLKAFHHYIFFCTMLLQELSCEHFDEMSAYVIRDVCHTLVHLIKKDLEPISDFACRYFYRFLTHILPARHSELEQNLSFIVSSLIPIVKAGRIQAAKLLNYLIVDQKEVLSDTIGKFYSFPANEVFEEASEVHRNLKYKFGVDFNLEMEIRHFLQAGNEEILSCSVEGLTNLRQHLSTRKTELQLMYSSLETLRGFSEDCASSMLHQLVCRLVKLTSSHDANISLEAAKCLGELGPADLTTMILKPEKTLIKVTSDPMVLFTYRVMALLSEYLIIPDMKLFKASADAMYIIGTSRWGQDLSKKDDLKQFKDRISNTEPSVRYEYICPFITGSYPGKIKQTVGIDKTKFGRFIDGNDELWTGKPSSSHADWVMDLTCNMLCCFQDSYLAHLIPVCKTKVSFCEVILPWIVDLMIRADQGLSDKLCYYVNRFFHQHYNLKITKSGQILSQKGICVNHESVQCMLNIVNFIRLQSEDNFQLELNYLHVAKAAQYCSAYFTSVLYAELWCETLLRESRGTEGLAVIEYICELEPDNGKALQDILREACIQIGDPDAIYGCGSSHLSDPSARIQHYVHSNKWDDVMLSYDIQLSLGSNAATRGLLDALQHSGLQSLLGGFMKNACKTENIDDYRYECAWRLSDWNMLMTQQIFDAQADGYVTVGNITSEDYHLYHYQALKCFHESDKDSLKTALDSARVSVIKALRNTSLESSKTVYRALSQLQMLREIEELSAATQDTCGTVLNKWKEQDPINGNDFQYLEPILAQRAIMLQSGSIGLIDGVKDFLVDTYLQTAETAGKSRSLQTAARALHTLVNQTDLSENLLDQLRYQEALLAWTKGDQHVGRNLMHNLIAKSSLDPKLLSQALRVYGNWMAETKSENPQMIIKKYYERSIACSKEIVQPKLGDQKNFLNTHSALAQFAHTQYQQIVVYMKSSQFESLKECVAYSRDAARKLNSSGKDSDVRRAGVIHQRQSNNDVAELENVERDKNMYLLRAVRHYLIILRQSDDHDLLLFRLVSLWLENRYHQELNELLKANLMKIPSHKFVPMVPQLAPHMSDVDDVFTTKIFALLKRCAIDHPHHTLPVLLALMNLYNDHEFYNSKTLKPKPEPRVLGATKLIEELRKTEINTIIQQMNTLAHALVELANFELPKPTTSRGNNVNLIPKNKAIHKIKNLDSTLVSTVTINVQPSGMYNNIVGVRGYVETFEAVGGLNAPKKVTCIGTNGQRINQLVKGKDDLRQDAVMQQVFTVMNSLLRTSKETKSRKLNVRTYKVVPLTQRSGVLEWCENTVPIDIALIGSDCISGLHKKYYPNDWTAKVCRKKMIDVDKKPFEVKLKAFMDCCKNLHPVFHYFFMENYPSPEIWFERKLAYVRSVATNSIIGYILGLGDRHLHNILIDKRTAEVIHIDFGIAFEQGKVLPTPETVPFRLTRDIEVAMGVSGVEGVMRRSCEETMTVLREQMEIIITLLQVLLYDPLFSWAITPAKACNIQSNNAQQSSESSEASRETNKLAERALLRLEQKLRGIEEGSASSVAGQVERLIQQARDPANLCRLFPGWQPYL